MTDWKDWTPVETQTKEVGPFRVVYLRPPSGSEGGHEIRFPDGATVRVYPDGRTSGQRRSRTISEALADAQNLGADALPLFLGRLAMAGLDWTHQPPDPSVSIEEWLAAWWYDQGVERPDLAARNFLGVLDADGWEIVRKGEN